MRDASISRPVLADRSVARTARFLDRLFPAPRPFAIRLWDGTVLPADGPQRFTLVIPRAGAPRRVFRLPIELSLGEAYLRRDLDIEGDLAAALDSLQRTRGQLNSPRELLGLLGAWVALPREKTPRAQKAQQRAELSGALHTPERDRAAIRYHYDVGNDFYQLFLDRRMVYSCAYFPTEVASLDEAQEAKLELICRKLRLRKGERLLDIGCGWGGLLVYAAQRYGVTGLGITLSEAQHRLAAERIAAAGLEGQVLVERMHYRDLPEDQRFDKIASVGMFEHVGRARYPEYFAKAFRLLAPGGLFLNHGIAARPGAHRGLTGRLATFVQERILWGNVEFRTRYIFPDGELVPLSETNVVAEEVGFEVRDVENLREHYVLTLQHWLTRLRQNRERAVELAGEPMYRLWELYLAISIYQFENAHITVNQSLLARAPTGSRFALPRTRADLYA